MAEGVRMESISEVSVGRCIQHVRHNSPIQLTLALLAHYVLLVCPRLYYFPGGLGTIDSLCYYTMSLK